MARTGATNEPLLVDVFLARKINGILGGAFFGPWNVGSLSADTLDQILSIERVGEIKDGFAKVEQVFDRWRSQHDRK